LEGDSGRQGWLERRVGLPFPCGGIHLAEAEAGGSDQNIHYDPTQGTSRIRKTRRVHVRGGRGNDRKLPGRTAMTMKSISSPSDEKFVGSRPARSSNAQQSQTNPPERRRASRLCVEQASTWVGGKRGLEGCQLATNGEDYFWLPLHALSPFCMANLPSGRWLKSVACAWLQAGPPDRGATRQETCHWWCLGAAAPKFPRWSPAGEPRS
jgi:hypothetical protein